MMLGLTFSVCRMLEKVRFILKSLISVKRVKAKSNFVPAGAGIEAAVPESTAARGKAASRSGKNHVFK
jgi:hypothetical protein